MVENQSQRCPKVFFKFKPMGMSHGLKGKNRIGLGYSRNGVSYELGSEDGRLTNRIRRMKGGESVRGLRLSMIH